MRIGLLVLCLVIASAAAHATEVKEVTTSGGLKAWLVEEHALPLIAIKVAFRDSGYAYDAPGKEGRSNMTAALLTEGAGGMDSRAFNEALENHAIQLNTGSDDDILSVTMETLSEHKDTAFSYLGLVLTQPRFDEASIERTRRQSLSLLVQQEQEPGYQLTRKRQKLLFGDHPYAHAQLGLEHTIKTLNRDDLKDFAQRYLTKENVIISVVGDITPQELSTLLDRSLSGLPATYNPDAKVPDIAIPQGGAPEVIDFNIPQTMVSFAAPGLKRSDPDYFSAYVLNQILGGGGSLTSRLGVEIREKRGLSYSVYSYLNPMAHAATWEGGFATRNDQAGDAVNVLRDTLKRFVKEGPTEKELADAKRYLTGSFVLNLDSNSEIANFLTSMQLNHLGVDYLKRRNSLVEAITAKDVHDIAKRLIDPEKLTIVMIGKPTQASDAGE